jgi:bifunctional non-homologous end joining protein LigD
MNEKRGVHWVRPELVAEVKFAQWTNEQLLRHPVFLGLRLDKSPQDVHKEEIPSHLADKKTTSKMASPPKRSSQKTSQNENIADVKLTHPDRILFPEPGITKRDLANYYQKIEPWILPYIQQRPLSIVRCPKGHEKDCFYQKHISDSVPDAIQGIQIKEKESGPSTYLMIEDLEGLISLIQMNVLEIHPWGCRVDKIEKPDIMIFDLDPDLGVEWAKIMDAANTLHDYLNGLGLQSFLKTSGGKGLHVVVPITRRSDWNEVKAFSGAVVQQIVKNDPKRYVGTMSKAKRKGKIFIDYFRNSRGATSVAPYSTRAKTNAPVSTPIRWDELNDQLRPDTYTLQNLPQRLSSLKKDPWDRFFDIRQSITAAMKKKVGLE